MPDLDILLPAALIILFCSALQSAVGFAFSLFSVPLLLLLGLPLPTVVAASVITSGAQRVMAVVHLRRAVFWRELGPLLAAGLVGLPLGVLLLRAVTGLEQQRVQQIVGAIIVLALLVQWAAKVKPRDDVPVRWAALAGLTSGVLLGLANIGGPPVVLWIHLHRWTNARIRVTALAYSLALAPIQLVMLPLVFGAAAWSGLILGLVLLPVSLAGSAVGLAVGRRLSADHLRRVAYALLLLLALSCLLRPYLRPG